MINYRRKSVSIAEFWFNEDIQYQTTDVIRVIQRSVPLDNKKYQEFYTILIDLTQDKDEIFNTMNKGTRNLIRRAAQKDFLIYENCLTDDEIIDQFVNNYNKFAQIKRIQRIGSRNLKEYARIGSLDISRVLTLEGSILAWLVFYKNIERVRAILNCSNYMECIDASYRSLLGRANRYLHWQNILKFKAQGVSIYDFGGWYQGDKDLAKLGINRFKEGFGGVIVKNFMQEFGITPKGRVYVILHNIRDMI
jgi:lipid II:glycine glycyltransferase (peptidoglycan interpeptide bridge formation enzyme)